MQKIIIYRAFFETDSSDDFNLQNPAGILLIRRGSILFFKRKVQQKGNKSIYQSPVKLSTYSKSKTKIEVFPFLPRMQLGEPE